MADKKLSELTELAATPASDDEVYIRDVSEEAALESKRVTIANLLAGPAVCSETEAAVIAGVSSAITGVIADVALYFNGITAALAASIYEEAALTAARVAFIFNEAGLAAQQAADIFDHANLSAAKVLAIFEHPNLSLERQEAIINLMSNITLGEASISDNIRNSNNDSKYVIDSSWKKVKEVLLNEDLPFCRLKYDYYGGGENPCDYQSRKNGEIMGALKSGSSFLPTTWAENFTDWVEGDLIQVYAHYTNSSEAAYVENMRFCYDIPVTHIRGEELATPVGITISVTNQDP